MNDETKSESILVPAVIAFIGVAGCFVIGAIFGMAYQARH